MTPDLLLLVQIYAHQQAYQVKILETLSVLYAKQEGCDNEKSQAFAKLVDAECEQSFDMIRDKILRILYSSYPEISQQESIESLLKKFSSN